MFEVVYDLIEERNQVHAEDRETGVQDVRHFAQSVDVVVALLQRKENSSD